jgi:hypothetical protein
MHQNFGSIPVSVKKKIISDKLAMEVQIASLI